MLRKFLSVLAVTHAGMGLAAMPAQAEEPVKIGLMEDLSSIFMDIAGPGSVTAAEFAIEDFGGEVLGRPIRLLAADHHNDPAQAAAIATEWIEQEKVGLITGISASAASLAVRQLARERGVLDIMSSGGATTLTNAQCSRTGFHWSWDSYMIVRSVADAVVAQGGDSWFFLSTDTPFGAASEAAGTQFIESAGGQVLGSIKVRHASADMSSFLLQAQTSGAQVVGLAIAGSDFINAVRQAREFGITPTQSLAAVVAFISDVHSIGLESAQGMYLSEPFYWDLNDKTREWSRRFMDARGAMPTTIQVGIYSAVYHYLKAVEAAGTTDYEAVAEKVREIPINDFWTEDAWIREDGRVMRPVHLFRVKSPDSSSGPWDYYEYVSTLSSEDAAQPLELTECPYLLEER